MKNWWRHLDSVDKKTITGVIVVAILAMTLIFSCVGLSAGSNYLKCQKYQMYMPEENIVWSFWTTCLIEAPDGTFVDADDYLGMGRFGLFLDETE